MRPSLSRSLVAAASLAVASAALVSTPANASGPSAAVTPAGVTRDMVLTAAVGYRAQDDATYVATMKAVRSIANRACGVDADNGEVLSTAEAIPTQATNDADGITVIGDVRNLVEETSRVCVVGAVAATHPGFTLTGNASLTVTTNDDGPIILQSSIASGPTTITTPLSGDVTTTAPYFVPAGEVFGDASLIAKGSSTHVEKTMTSRKVADKKSKAQKKAAKATYDKRIKAAKKSYEKALKKAGSSKSKKAAAKKLYAEKKAGAKAAYKYAIANYKLVKKTTTKTDSRPFSLTTPML